MGAPLNSLYILHNWTKGNPISGWCLTLLFTWLRISMTYNKHSTTMKSPNKTLCKTTDSDQFRKENRKYQFADGRGRGGEGGDGVREDPGKKALELVVVSQGKASEHPIEHLLSISIRRRCRRWRRCLGHGWFSWLLRLQERSEWNIAYGVRAFLGKRP